MREEKHDHETLIFPEYHTRIRSEKREKLPKYNRKLDTFTPVTLSLPETGQLLNGDRKVNAFAPFDQGPVSTVRALSTQASQAAVSSRPKQKSSDIPVAANPNENLKIKLHKGINSLGKLGQFINTESANSSTGLRASEVGFKPSMEGSLQISGGFAVHCATNVPFEPGREVRAGLG
ncbi:hypothetical protein PoB_007276600 [Plakobranchus ocellatus]|uniref:Uncharacterized protein n=1 Tax=Plakobranchus ocellatus TaxID=259542 RepID=A0AAV4DQX0_9GAST|nr:hypothetical protein PoB_007276600 [Plakobranchus ocellatus]